MTTGNLTEKDQDDMDKFLGFLLEDFKSGAITKKEAIGHLGHVITAIDQGNHGEAVGWFREGRKPTRKQG